MRADAECSSSQPTFLSYSIRSIGCHVVKSCVSERESTGAREGEDDCEDPEGCDHRPVVVQRTKWVSPSPPHAAKSPGRQFGRCGKHAS